MVKVVRVVWVVGVVWVVFMVGVVWMVGVVKVVRVVFFEDVPIKCKSGASAEYALVLGAIDFYWSPGMS